MYGEEQSTTLLLPPASGTGEPIPATVTPLTPIDPPARTPILQHVATLFCVLACLFFLTVNFTNALTVLSRLDLTDCMLQWAERCLLGGAEIRLVPRSLDRPTLDFPVTDPATTPQDMPEATTQPDTTAVRYPIVQADLSASSDSLALTNETDYTPDCAALLASPLPFPTLEAHQAQFGAGAPYILILHTHATEAYAAENATDYSLTDAFRTGDPLENVVAVGDVLAQTLTEAGVPVLHCTEMFDALSYQSSYSRAAETIRATLAQYPSIQIILDVHRDSILRSDKTKIQPVTADGIAQVMLVVGTDFKGADFPNWEENLTFALKLQKAMQAENAAVMRRINLRGAAFNEQYRPGSLLVEVGSCGNSLSQAKKAGSAVAQALLAVCAPSGEQKRVRLTQIGEDQIRLLLD